MLTACLEEMKNCFMRVVAQIRQLEQAVERHYNRAGLGDVVGLFTILLILFLLL